MGEILSKVDRKRDPVAVSPDLHSLEPLVQRTVDERLDSRYRDIIDNDLEDICRHVVMEELEMWAEKEARERIMESPKMTKKVYRQQSKSAKQLPMRISKINESIEEESPEALPRHNMPPPSYVDGRSSALNSEYYLETRSVDGKLRFSAEPREPISRISQGEKINFLREDKKDRLRDYLREKFRPPSEGRASVRSFSSSKNHLSPDYSKNKLGPMVSFGASENKDENSIGMLRMSNSSPPGHRPLVRDSYSFLNNGSRAREVINSMDKAPRGETDLRNRMSFGRASDDIEEFTISSKPILHYSEDLNDDNRFGLSNKGPNMKSQKYMQNVRLSDNKYMDVEDVIMKNKKLNRNHL